MSAVTCPSGRSVWPTKCPSHPESPKGHSWRGCRDPLASEELSQWLLHRPWCSSKPWPNFALQKEGAALGSPWTAREGRLGLVSSLPASHPAQASELCTPSSAPLVAFLRPPNGASCPREAGEGLSPSFEHELSPACAPTTRLCSSLSSFAAPPTGLGLSHHPRDPLNPCLLSLLSSVLPAPEGFCRHFPRTYSPTAESRPPAYRWWTAGWLEPSHCSLQGISTSTEMTGQPSVTSWNLTLTRRGQDSEQVQKWFPPSGEAAGLGETPSGATPG